MPLVCSDSNATNVVRVAWNLVEADDLNVLREPQVFLLLTPCY
jgi:hypothetical protein